MGSLPLERPWGRQPISRQLTAVFLGVLLSYGIRLSVAAPGEDLGPLHITLFASVAASLLSVSVIRSFAKYPGAESVSSILTAVSLVYAALMAVLLVVRIDYARGMLFGNYLACIIFLFFQQLVWPAKRQLRIAMIRGGAAQPLEDGNIDWILVDDPGVNLTKVDAVTVDLRADHSDEWERRITELALANTPVYHIKHLRESLTGQVELEHLSETSYGTLSPPIAYIAAKRLVDTVVALIGLLALWPVMIVVAVLIKLDSPGPAIFKQRRVGFRGRVFWVRKFRTMQVPNKAEDERDAAMTRDGDHRITKVGGFLRKSRLDELPQLINVIRGEMSLIGPRPEAEVLSKWYEQEIPFYRYRHIVLPGVTGWAQINQGHVTDVEDVTAKLHYDFYYIKNISPWIDALIAVRTIIIMVSGHGAK